MQKGMLFHTLLAPESGMYVEQIACELDECSPHLFRAAWERVMTRHDALRAAFVWEGVDEPVQVIAEQVALPWAEEDWSDLSPDVCELRFDEFLREDRSRGFALQDAPLMRFTLIRTAPGKHRFVWTHHHLLLDGWSLRIVFSEVAACYDAAFRGEIPSLARTGSYRDFIGWIERQDAARAEAFWRGRLGDLREPSPLPGIESPASAPARVLHAELAVPGELTARLEELARGLRVTFYSLIQGAWAVLANRYDGREDVVFGCTVSGRPAELRGVEQTVGLFINTIPARVRVDAEARVSGWLRGIHADLAAAEPYGWCSLTDIQGWSGVPSGASLFETLVVFESFPGRDNAQSQHLRVGGFRSSYRTNYPLNLIAELQGGRLLLRLDLDTARIGDETAGPRLLRHLRNALASIADRAEGLVGELDIETEADERDHAEWNDTRRDFPGCGLAELFEETVAAHGDRIAVEFGDTRLTYRELNERANRFAWYLRGRGVGAVSLVGMSVDEGFDAVFTMLAVIKAGGAYVPLRPEDPRRAELARRLRWMVISGADSTGLDGLTEQGLDVISLAGDREAIAACSAANPPIVSGARHLAYAIHTSGSTGLPKGIAVPQEGVVRLARNTDYIDIAPGMRFGQISTYAFDAMTFEVWGALVNGGCVVDVPREVKLSPKRLAAHVKDRRIDAMFLTAALFNQTVSEEPAAFATMKTLLVGGEALSPRWIGEALRNGAPERLLNGYGPTECTTFAIWHDIGLKDLGASVPIGKPLANTTAYVVGRGPKRQPVGAMGEIWLGGPGLARGYLGDARLTADRFVPDPFSGEPGARLYRTGDLGRRREDGTIEYAGRLDSQIKLRGFRIELGEIEAALKACAGVRDAAVQLRDGRIVAWAAVEDGVAAAELRRALAAKLPEYMVPSAIAALASLPLNSNGKIDRQNLPEIEAESEPSSAGADAVLDIVCGLFADVLGAGAVSPDTNFFELGGHSLSATQLISRVRDTLSVEVELRGLFEHPTPAGIARLVRQARVADPDLAAAPAVEPAPAGSEPVLSFAQERLWFLNQLEPESPFYNTPGLVRLEGQLRADALERAFREIVSRHRILRTRYENRGGKPFPIVDATPESVALYETDLRGLSDDDRATEARRISAAEIQAPFDLSKGPVIRFRLLRMAADEHLLIVVMHHIVSDGWSMGVLVKEAVALYRAFAEGREPDLGPLAIQYSDFAAWQRRWLQGPVLERQFDYWKRKLDGVPPALALPTDRPRPRVQSFRGATLGFQIDARVAEPLKALGRRNGATPFMVLLAGFSVLLHRFSGQRDLVIGSPIANRNRTGIEPLIGFFVNTLALRVELERDPTFEELLERVRDTALEAFDRQDLPFERLVEELQPERDLSRSPLFQAMFTMQSAPAGELSIPGLTLRPVTPEHPSALFDLSLDMWGDGGGFRGALEYATDLFDAETATRMVACFGRLLEAIADDASLAVSAIPLLTDAERKKVLAFGEGGRLEYPRLSLGELVERQAAVTPDRIAVEHNGRALTYAELNRRANRIAHGLRARGIRTNELVGVLEDRGLDYACALLGIVKSGAAFVPFDTGYPVERVKYMVADSGVSVVVANAQLAARYGLEPVSFDGFPEENPAPVNAAGDTAYAMYTSGSTGMPKAALVRHNGAVSHIYAEARELKMHAGTAFLQSAPASSDISVWQYFGPWLLGGRTAIVDAAVVSDAARLFEALRAGGITLIELVPAVLQELLHYAASLPAEARALPALECAMVTGEAAPVALINRWFGVFPHVPLVNAYGPTEAADDICQAKYTGPLPQELAAAPIGRPLANLTLYILDANLRLAPAGVAGEICVAGIGVGKGYWKRDDLTRASFVPNPHPGAGRILYRTGDLGRWRSDGQIEFAGRIDAQVKVRGFRVETGEIESALLRHGAVRDAVVGLAGPEENRRLVAWLTADAESAGPLPVEQLEREQVSLWEALHDNSYRETAGSDPEFNTIGWDSNYTRSPLSEAEMREYVGFTVERVLAAKPARILEIGCGTGLLAYPLARGCEEYYGTDLSASAIDRLAAQARGRGLANARFEQRYAHDFEGVPGEFDAILLASVIQYFPGPDYFLRVIAGALERLAPGGAIHVTDVRSLPLLRAFHASVQLFQAGDDVYAAELRRRVGAQLRREQELAFDPALFRQLQARFPKIRRVEIAPKRGTIDNEMTRFRYDVSIYTAEAHAAACVREEFAGIEDVALRLSAGAESLGLRRIPNLRTAAETRLLVLLDGKSSAGVTAGALRDALGREPLPGAHPEALRELARRHGYEVRLSQWESRADGAFDAVFLKPGAPEPLFFEAEPDTRPAHALVNNPLREKLQAFLAPQLRDYLKDRLPGHMVPVQFMVLEAMPLGPSGKVDRGALPAPDEIASGIEYAAPSNDLERKIAAVWSEVLELPADAVGVNDNFFALGGHSLNATRVASRIHRDLGIDLPVREIFGAPTVAELARLMPRLAKGIFDAIPQAPEAAFYPLSPGQRSIWTHAQMHGTGALYNMPSARTIEGDLNVAALERAFDAVLRRHESLRTAIVERNGEGVQAIVAESPVRLRRVEFASDEEARQWAEREAMQPLDIAAGETMRAALARLSARRHLFTMTVSHLVFDGQSETVFFNDLAQAYAQAELPKLPLQYKDYALWRRGAVDASTEYWLGELSLLPPVLELPCDKPRPGEKTYAGSVVSADLGADVSRRLREFAAASGAGVYAAVVALTAALLHRYSGQTDMILGAPTDGRDHPDLESQIGLYVNVLPLRCKASGEDSFATLLARVSATIGRALEHRDFALDELIAKGFRLSRQPGRLPLIEAVVSLLRAGKTQAAGNGLRIEPFDFDFPVSQYDAAFYFNETAAGLTLELRYCADLFSPETAQRLVRRLAGMAGGAVRAPRIPLSDIAMGSALPGDEEAHRFFWQSRLRGYEEPRASDTGASQVFRVSPETDRATALAAFAALLFHYSRKERTIVGWAAAHTLPVCLDVSPEMLFSDLVSQARTRLEQAEAHGYLPVAARMDWILSYDAAGKPECAADAEMLRHYKIPPASCKVGDIEILTSADIERELNLWNPSSKWPEHETIVTLFEEQVRRHGAREALTMGNIRLTYAELNARANRIAHRLLAQGVQPQELVGVSMERSPDLIAALLGILKAGAAYLPFAPDLPAERVAFMTADAGLKHWVRTEDAASADACSDVNPGLRTSPADLAYCLFTSGSTGRPKGVLVEHRNVVRLLFNSAFQFDFSERDVWTMFHSASFDFSVWEIFGALLYGGRLVMVPRQTTADPDVFAALLARESVTVLNQTPGAFYHLIPATKRYPELALRYVIFGGEALQPVQLRDFRRRFPAVRIVNMYGITETTVHVTYKEIGDAEIEANSASVGLPIPTTTLYIMDEKQRPMPPGAPGEICVGGAGVARGYLNRAELTAARFVRNPLRPEERMYRSGDRGRRLANGEIAYLGRIDNQAQIRGFRVELGEVEEALSSCPGIVQGAVVAREQDGTYGLVAYYAPDAADPEAVRAHLRSRLPEYMVPGVLIPLRRLPVTDNGKVDRAALPAPESVLVAAAEELQPPSNDTEARIGEVWMKVLGRETFGANQNFFDAGGDSLRLMALRAGLRESFGKDIPVAELFRYSTVAGLAQYLGGGAEDEVKSEADERAAQRRNARSRRAAGR
jgi:amino acid adenylation domain-containing protein